MKRVFPQIARNVGQRRGKDGDEKLPFLKKGISGIEERKFESEFGQLQHAMLTGGGGGAEQD